MGIRFSCPSGHKLHVKEFLAGKRGICPHCGAKFVIPAASEQPQSATRQTANELHARPAGSLSSAGNHGQLDTGSQSIIIAVADAAPPPAPPAESGLLAAPPATVGPPMPMPRGIAPPPVPAIVTEPVVPASSGTRYEMYRQRARRNQLTIAVVLLIAVIILALVLIWVLRNGTGQSTARLYGQSYPQLVKTDRELQRRVVRYE